jgi:hypothetical protein
VLENARGLSYVYSSVVLCMRVSMNTITLGSEERVHFEATLVQDLAVLFLKYLTETGLTVLMLLTEMFLTVLIFLSEFFLTISNIFEYPYCLTVLYWNIFTADYFVPKYQYRLNIVY